MPIVRYVNKKTEKNHRRHHFYHLDEQNSTAYITGMKSGIENRYQYDVFGVIRDRQERFDRSSAQVSSMIPLRSSTI